jgi:hypothetical protein
MDERKPMNTFLENIEALPCFPALVESDFVKFFELLDKIVKGRKMPQEQTVSLIMKLVNDSWQTHMESDRRFTAFDFCAVLQRQLNFMPVG